jgi:PPOX class probable F420-dependent enzyme
MDITGKAEKFLSENRKAVLTTFKRNGMPQMSIVVSAPFRGGAGASITESRAKYKNLKRDPRCSLLVSKDDWWGYVVLEGSAELIDSSNSSDEERLTALRELYRVITGGDHPDWEEYDRSMLKDERAVLIVRPDRIYGTALN